MIVEMAELLENLFSGIALSLLSMAKGCLINAVKIIMRPYETLFVNTQYI